MSNVLAIPKAHASILTGTNEDWVDCLCYLSGSDTGPQMDLRGISFEMEMRRQPPDHEVILHIGTDVSLGGISIGAVPNTGYLIFYVPEAMMEQIQPGAYVGDVRAFDTQFERVVLNIDFTIVQGVTR
jgi:hypothetical protein